jgi:L,D-transpeptidase YcbB
MRARTRKSLAALAWSSLSLAATASVFAASPAPDPASHSLLSPTAAPPSVHKHLWSVENLAVLQSEISATANEGLDPEFYDPAGLATIASRGESAQADAAATRATLAVARDYLTGRITEKPRFDWHIENPEPDMNLLHEDLRSALREGRLQPWLRSLLPQDARYAALRAAYSATPMTDRATRDQLRANMERWRWMPRDLGKDHIYVNVPSYTLDVVDEGQAVSTYTVVVGKPSTPTPQIAVEAQSIVVNPWWNVPTSIARTMRPGRKGFVTTAKGGFRQPPGPANALGKVKIDMPNPHSIYLHDTPSKALFDEESRAFSHGCIRVKDIDRLALQLAALDRGEDQTVRKALAGSATRTVALGAKRPVYLVYFTADASADGRVTSFEDPYNRDPRLLAALDGKTRSAALNLQNKALGRGR